MSTEGVRGKPGFEPRYLCWALATTLGCLPAPDNLKSQKYGDPRARKNVGDHLLTVQVPHVTDEEKEAWRRKDLPKVTPPVTAQLELGSQISGFPI